MVILANATFLDLLAGEPGLSAVADADAIAAGAAMCDAMDRGDSLQAVLIAGAGMAPAAGSPEDVAAIAGAASGTLCPEHASYVD